MSDVQFIYECVKFALLSFVAVIICCGIVIIFGAVVYGVATVAIELVRRWLRWLST